MFAIAIGKSPVVGYHKESWHWREKSFIEANLFLTTSCAEDFIFFIVAVFLFVTFGVMLEKYIRCGSGCCYSINFSVGNLIYCDPYCRVNTSS